MKKIKRHDDSTLVTRDPEIATTITIIIDKIREEKRNFQIKDVLKVHIALYLGTSQYQYTRTLC